MTDSHRAERPLLSILIVNYEASEDLDACLSSIEASHEAPPHEIVVVDNASSDFDLRAMRAKHPSTQFIAMPWNTGFTAACNIANAQASGDYVLLLNPDTRLAKTTLSAAIDAAQDPILKPNVVGAYLFDLDGRFQKYYRRLPDLLDLFGLAMPKPFAHLRRFRRYLMEDVQFSGIMRVEQPPGAFMLLRRPATSELLLTGGYVNHFSDVDLAWRLGNGGATYIYPEVRVAHRRGGAGLRTADPVVQDWLRYDHDYGLRLYARRRFGRMAETLVTIALFARWSIAATRSMSMGDLQRATRSMQNGIRLLFRRVPSARP